MCDTTRWELILNHAPPPSILMGRTSSKPRLLRGVSRLLPTRYPSPNPKLFDQPASNWFVGIESLTPRLEFFLGRLHKLTALVFFLGIHLEVFACRFVVKSRWSLERKTRHRKVWSGESIHRWKCHEMSSFPTICKNWNHELKCQFCKSSSESGTSFRSLFWNAG